MLSRPAVRAVILPLVVLALVLATGWWVNTRVAAADTRAPLASALDALPSGTVVAGFTDWAAIRADLGLDGKSSARVRTALSDDASLRDLTTRSVLGGAVDDMHRLYGWSTADVQWEAYGQSSDGAAMVARLSRSVSFDDVEKRLRADGYTRAGGTWTIGDAGRQKVGQELATTLGAVALVPGRRLVVASSTAEQVPVVLATIRHDRTSLLARRPVADVAQALAGSATVLVQAREEGCRATSVGDDADVAAQADAAATRAGGLVAPVLTGRGLVDGSPRQRITFAAAFDSPAEAADQVQVRARLASGAFIGRSGRVEDSLRLTSSGVRGSVSSLRFDLDAERGAYMSGEGPLLFDGCPS